MLHNVTTMMFSRKKSDLPKINMDKVETIVGSGTKINGDIKAEGILRVEGNIEGNIECIKDLILAESGEIKAELKAENAIIAGKYNGNMDISGNLEIKETGKVIGDVNINGLIVEDGGILDGNCNMKNKAQNEKNLKLVKTDKD